MDVVNDRGAGRWRAAVWGLAACLLLPPLVAMQFTAEVTWDGDDFLVFGAMLFIACAAFELIMRTTRRTAYRAAAGAAVVALFVLVWVELAVGIFS